MGKAGRLTQAGPSSFDTSFSFCSLALELVYHKTRARIAHCRQAQHIPPATHCSTLTATHTVPTPLDSLGPLDCCLLPLTLRRTIRFIRISCFADRALPGTSSSARRRSATVTLGRAHTARDTALKPRFGVCLGVAPTGVLHQYLFQTNCFGSQTTLGELERPSTQAHPNTVRPYRTMPTNYAFLKAMPVPSAKGPTSSPPLDRAYTASQKPTFQSKPTARSRSSLTH